MADRLVCASHTGQVRMGAELLTPEEARELAVSLVRAADRVGRRKQASANVGACEALTEHRPGQARKNPEALRGHARAREGGPPCFVAAGADNYAPPLSSGQFPLILAHFLGLPCPLPALSCRIWFYVSGFFWNLVSGACGVDRNDILLSWVGMAGNWEKV